jgi:hypothetical protein
MIHDGYSFALAVYVADFFAYWKKNEIVDAIQT